MLDLVAHLARSDGPGEDLLTPWLAAHTSNAERALLLTTLKDESERLLVSDPAAAERLARVLIATADQLQQPRFKALGLMAQGDVRRAQGGYADAVDLYEQGGAACLALGDEIGWARSRIGWVFASQFCGRGREALPSAEKAYAVLATAGEHVRAGALSNNLAGVHYQLGEYDRALAVFDRAIRHFERAAQDNPELKHSLDERIAKALTNQALALTLLGRFDEAIQRCDVAREIFSRAGEIALALRVDHHRASIYAGRGQYTRALKIQGDALAEFERAGLDEAAIQVAQDMIVCLLALNRNADALALAEDLVARCEAAGAVTEAAKARFLCARARAALGDVSAALDLLGTVSGEFSAAGLTAELGLVSLQRARLELKSGSWNAAADLAWQAHDLFAQRGLLERRTQAELIRAHAALGLGAADEAADLAQAVLRTSNELNALPLSHAAHHILARVADARAAPDRALAEYDAAIDDLDRLQSALTSELRTEFLGDKLQVYLDAIDFCLRHQHTTDAFAFLERAKSRALLDYVAARPDIRVPGHTAAEQALADQLRQLREEHAWFYGRLHGFGPSSEAGPPSSTEHDKLQAAVNERERRIVALQHRLALLRDAEGLESLAAAPASAERAAVPTLTPGTVLLEYVFWADRGAVFVVTSRGLTVQPLVTGATALRRLLQRWQLNLDATAALVHDGGPMDRLTHNANGHLAALYRALIEPVAGHLEAAERLVVVPYGPAHGVPFQALFDGRKHVLQRLEVSTCPSSGILALCAQRRKPSAAGALVVGYSGGSLPAVLTEARTVADLLGGVCFLEEEATRAAVIAESPRHGIIHLAAHGEARLDNPAFAHIALADGQLEMADVFGLPLDGALVTLSACETGRSAVVGGDELVGLSRGFLFAGAATLVQSLWRVDDASTAELMRNFYTALSTGHAPAAALRQAQQAMLESNDCNHPYLWAPFQVVGYG